MIPFGPSAEEETFLAELRAFLAENQPDPVLVEQRRERPAAGPDIPQWLKDWQATLFDAGWLVPANPPQYGGRGATRREAILHQQEMGDRGIPRSGHFTGYQIVGPTLLELGDRAQRDLAAPALRGDTVWCLGMSEPGAGSDFGALTTRAVRDGDDYLVTGEKLWSTYSPIADMCLLYARTDPAGTKHHGLSALLVDLRAPGVEVRPIRTLAGEFDFGQIRFEEVRVPRAMLLGHEGGGWAVAVAGLAHERRGLWMDGLVGLRQMHERLRAVAGSPGARVDITTGAAVTDLGAQIDELEALGYRYEFGIGDTRPAQHSLLKLATSELGHQIADLALALVPHGAHRDGAAAAAAYGYLLSFQESIGGGTSEMQRNTVAERLLELPRAS